MRAPALASRGLRGLEPTCWQYMGRSTPAVLPCPCTSRSECDRRRAPAPPATKRDRTATPCGKRTTRCHHRAVANELSCDVRDVETQDRTPARSAAVSWRRERLETPPPLRIPASEGEAAGDSTQLTSDLVWTRDPKDNTPSSTPPDGARTAPDVATGCYATDRATTKTSPSAGCPAPRRRRRSSELPPPCPVDRLTEPAHEDPETTTGPASYRLDAPPMSSVAQRQRPLVGGRGCPDRRAVARIPRTRPDPYRAVATWPSRRCLRANIHTRGRTRPEPCHARWHRGGCRQHSNEHPELLGRSRGGGRREVAAREHQAGPSDRVATCAARRRLDVRAPRPTDSDHPAATRPRAEAPYPQPSDGQAARRVVLPSESSEHQIEATRNTTQHVTLCADANVDTAPHVNRIPHDRAIELRGLEGRPSLPRDPGTASREGDGTRFPRRGRRRPMGGAGRATRQGPRGRCASELVHAPWRFGWDGASRKHHCQQPTLQSAKDLAVVAFVRGPCTRPAQMSPHR